MELAEGAPGKAWELLIRIPVIPAECERHPVLPRSTQKAAEDEACRHDFERRLRRVLELHYSEPGLSAGRLARLLFMSQSTLYRWVRKTANTSPIRLLRDYRLDRARALLARGDGTVAAIAEEAGFDSRIYFTACFKKKYRLTPSQWVADAGRARNKSEKS